MRWYLEKDLPLYTIEEEELLVGWGYKVILMDLQWAIFMKGSFTKKVTGSGQAIFEGGVQFCSFEARKKFNITSSSDRWLIGGWLERNQGASDQAISGNRSIAGNLWEIRNAIINEWSLFIFWHFVCMSWNSVNWPKSLWIGTHIGKPILSTYTSCW